MAFRTGWRRAAVFTSLLVGIGGQRLVGQWRLEAWLGNAWSLNSRLTLKQEGESDITTTAHWSTRPWRPTWYFAGRIAKWSDSSAWAFEYMHHKLYLDNLPPEVQAFRITNGVNQLMAERLWRRRGWEYGVGAGPVFDVTISRVRGLSAGHANGVFGSAYEFGGAVIGGNLARRVRLLPFTYGTASLKATVAYLDVSIANGSGKTLNYALHFNYGISLQAKR